VIGGRTLLERPSPWQRVRPLLSGFDGWLLLAVALLATIGLVAMYSAGHDHGTRFAGHARNLLIGLGLLLLVSQVPPQRLMSAAVPLYVLGLLLLVATDLFGVTRKGAQRWLDLGPIVIQPSEIMKLALPLMLAWWYARGDAHPRWRDHAGAAALLLLPFLLIASQPDLGTGLLVLSVGVFVVFFAGLPWRLVVPLLALGAAALLALLALGDTLCRPGVDWVVLKEYQKTRVCTLLEPGADPLGEGFHVLQSTIAIGSGGLWGQGFMAGTQTHLEFIPERTSDFIFATYAEEFGLAGVFVLLAAYLLLILRGLTIALEAPTAFSRLLAGALTLGVFIHVFVNIGMVSGILPVVGMTLPFVSYGGTALLTLGLSLGILMGIARSRRLMPS